MKTEKTSLSRIPWTDDAVAGTVLPFRLRLFYSKMKTETLTITFSKKFANSAREVAYLFADEKEDLGKTIENMCDSYFEQLVKNDRCAFSHLLTTCIDCGNENRIHQSPSLKSRNHSAHHAWQKTMKSFANRAAGRHRKTWATTTSSTDIGRPSSIRM